MMRRPLSLRLLAQPSRRRSISSARVVGAVRPRRSSSGGVRPPRILVSRVSAVLAVLVGCAQSEGRPSSRVLTDPGAALGPESRNDDSDSGSSPAGSSGADPDFSRGRGEGMAGFSGDLVNEPARAAADGGAERDAGTNESATGDVVPDPPSEDFERCTVGVPRADRGPQALPLSGDLGAHDPVIIKAHDRYYYFSTGNGIATKVSENLFDWRGQPAVFPSTPGWFRERVPAYEPRNIWAPDIAYFGGQYHLYYSVSSFGSNRSCIGHATRPALDAGGWVDHEDVICSNQPGNSDDWNAIDPNIVLDEAGTPWMSFGSFWSGIKMIRLDLDGNRVSDELYDLASRGGDSIEAPFIVRRCGFYYLFVSFGACCRGVDSTYSIHVGRSPDLLGPYVDRAGTPMMRGGGTRVLERGGDWVGPGHNAILIDGDSAYNVYHAYSAQNGASQLRIAELVWDDEGWPVSGGP